MATSAGLIVFDHRDKRTDGHPWAKQADAELGPSAIVNIAHLELGDVEWQGAGGKTHIMELKTASDFVNSMKRNHIQDQVARMLEWQNEEPEKRQAHLAILGYLQSDSRNYLCYSDGSIGRPDFDDGIVGARNPQRLRIPTLEPAYRPFAYARAYLTSIKTLGLFIHEGIDPEAFGINFKAIYDWTLKQRHAVPARRKVKVLEPQVQALMALSPRMSQPAARNLLKEFGNFINVVNASADELAAVPKVGAATIYDLLFYTEREIKIT